MRLLLVDTNEDAHINIFPMSHDQFNYILEKVRPYIERQNTTFRDSISPRYRLALTLLFLAIGTKLHIIFKSNLAI